MPEPVLDDLAGRDWPGNFRELAGGLCALAALHDPGEALTTAALPPPSGRSAPSAAFETGDLSGLTETAMKRAVAQNNGNLSAAARALNIDRSTLYRRLIWKGPPR